MPDAFCDLFTSHEPNNKNNKIFELIENNSIIDNENEEKITLEYDFNDTHICLPNLSEFPEHFVSYINQIHSDLINSAKDIIGLIRWVKGISGKQNPFSQGELFWSKDNLFWHQIPIGFGSFFEIQPGIQLNKSEKESIYKLYDSGIREPVNHELFREAWAQRFSNPRSSIIMGVTAVEVGVKMSISKLVPDAEWLISQLQSPPIYNILRDYWPMLPVKNKINNQSSFPDSRLEPFRIGVNIRNTIVHKGDDAPEIHRVIQILEAIKDILLLLDYYCGFGFTYDFINDDRIRSLTANLKT